MEWIRRQLQITKEYPITFGLFYLHITIFLYLLLIDFSLSPETLRQFGAQYNPDIWRGEYYRLVTSGLLHGSFFHLFLNNYALYFLGRLLEKILGSLHFFVLYFFSLLAGSLATLYWMPPESLSVGSSGAIMGLAGALVVFLLLDREQRFLVTTKFGKFFFIFLVALNLAIGEIFPIINNAAHLGGFSVGVLYALYFWSRIPEKKKLIPRTIGTAMIFSIFMGVVLLFAAGLSKSDYLVIERAEDALRKGEFEKARRLLYQTLEEAASSPIFYVYLGQYAFYTEKFEDAEKFFSVLYEMESSQFQKRPILWYLWLYSLQYVNKTKRLEQILQRALDSLKKYPPPQRELLRARLLGAGGKYREAMLLYNRLMEKYPKEHVIYNDAAWMLVSALDPKYRNPFLAEKYIRYAISLIQTGEPPPSYLDTLATALFLLGKYRRAIELERQALRRAEKPFVKLHLFHQLKKFERRALSLREKQGHE